MNGPTNESELEDYCASALVRAQLHARARGYIRSALPSWGLEETRSSLGSMVGTSEDAAVDLSAPTLGEEGPQSRIEGDEDGDLTALQRAAIRAGAKWAKSPGLAPMRLKYRSAGRIDTVLNRMIQRNQWDTPTKMGSIMAKWPQIVGDTVAQHCEVETFEDHRLIVRCSSTAWAKQLHLLLATIERRIDEEVGSGVVTQVIIRGPLAPSWKKGPLSVPGRGPRDTYG